MSSYRIIRKLLCEASKDGRLDIVSKLVSLECMEYYFSTKTDQKDIDWSYELRTACEGGNMNIVQLLISKGVNNWNAGLDGACSTDNVEIINLMIKNVTEQSTLERYSEDDALYYACTHGNRPISQLLIDQGYDNWRLALAGAAEYGHADIFDFILIKFRGTTMEKILSGAEWDYLCSFRTACEGGNIDIVQFIVDIFRSCKNNEVCLDWNDGLQGACLKGRMNVIEYILREQEEDSSFEWNQAMDNACEGGNIDIVKLTVSKGAINFEDGMVSACQNGHIKVVEYLINNGSNSVTGFGIAVMYGHLNVVNYLLNNCPESDKQTLLDLVDFDMFTGLCSDGHLELIELLVKPAFISSFNYSNIDIHEYDRDILLFLLVNGVHLPEERENSFDNNVDEFILTYFELIYLYKKGVTFFGKYINDIETVKERLQYSENILRTNIPVDLVNLIVEF